VELVVVNRRNAALARRIQQRFGFQHATDDWREALSYGLDAVVVATPPNVHLEQVTAALESGAHVLCEKPFAITAADAWQMVDTARRTGRALLIAFGWNYMPLVRAARQLLDEREVGNVELVTLDIGVAVRELLSKGRPYNVSDASVPPEPDTFINPSVSGGGQAPVTMSHAFGMALYLTRLRAREIHARMFHAPVTGVDLHNALTVLFENGAIATFSGAASHESVPRVEWRVGIYGTGGQLLLDSNYDDVHFAADDGAIYRADLPPGSGIYEPTGPVRELIAVAKGANPSEESPGELGAQTVELVEAAYRSRS
jgi:predicted dehydrogenase